MNAYHMTAYFENALRHNYYSKEEVQVFRHPGATREPGTAFTLCVLREDPAGSSPFPSCAGAAAYWSSTSRDLSHLPLMIRSLSDYLHSVILLEYLLALVFQNYIPGFSFQCGASLSFRSFRTLKRHYSQALYFLNRILLGAEKPSYALYGTAATGHVRKIALSSLESYPPVTKLEPDNSILTITRPSSFISGTDSSSRRRQSNYIFTPIR